MLKKIRCIYWSMLDRGKGKQAILAGVVLMLTIVLLLASMIKGIVVEKNQGKVPNEIGVSGSAVSGTSVATESALAGEDLSDAKVQEETLESVPSEIEVDTSGLDAFHGFMSDEAYVKMEGLVIEACKLRNCKWVKKLDYQQTNNQTFDVVSFLLSADGSIFQCDYNLKSNGVSVTPTAYSEADINGLRENEIKKEQEKIKKQQEAERKKLEQAMKKRSKKSKKLKGKKKK